MKRFSAKVFIKAIPGSAGIITTIAERVGCDWNTAKKYINLYTSVRKAYENECECLKDEAESTIITALKAKDLPMSKWYLMQKGKDRGYGADPVVEISQNVLSWAEFCKRSKDRLEQMKEE